MKYLYLVILLILLTLETSAQSPPASSGLLLLEKKWSVHRIVSSNSALMNTDPFEPIKETTEEIEDRRVYLRDKAIREKRGLPPQDPPLNRVKAPVAETPNAFKSSYNYQIKIRNNGTKTIRMIVWDYVFFDSTTSKEVGKLQFISKTNLKPDRVDILVMNSFAPPAVQISAKDTGKKMSNLYVEQVNIKRIEYTDGSVWLPDSK